MAQFPQNIFINYPPFKGGRIPKEGLEANAFPQIVLGDFGRSGTDTDDTMMLPLNVLGGESPENTELRLWEDTYAAGSTLRRLCQAHLSYDYVDLGAPDWNDRRPDNIRMADLNARDGSVPDYSDQLIDLLGNFEYDGMETGVDIIDLEDPLGEVTATSRWMVDTLYPAARDRVAAYRNPPAGKPAGYFDELDVSWTRPEAVTPFVYNKRYAAHADGDQDDEDDEDQDDENQDDEDQEDESDENQGENKNDSEAVRMRKLGSLEKWDDVKPRYELRSLEFGCPTVKPLKDQPPGAGGGSDDEGA